MEYEGGENKVPCSCLQLPDGNEYKSVDIEAEPEVEGLTNDDLNQLDNEVTPLQGSTGDFVGVSSKAHVSGNVNKLNCTTAIRNGELTHGNEASFVDLEAEPLGEGPMSDGLNQLDNEVKPLDGPTGDLVGVSSNAVEASLVTESVHVSDNVNNLNSTPPIQNGDLTCRGVKRARDTSNEQLPSVNVTFSSLTSRSKKKLEQLLQQWSEWDATNCSTLGSTEALESGEATYYPALNVGVDKPSTVSFWLDFQTSKNKEVGQMNDGFVPVYDRGYAFALTSGDGYSHLSGDSGLVDDSRCFNCGSYNHSMRECPKPRDNAAVKNARKQHNTKRNQNPNSRNPTRYYQDTPSGKYDGVRPGLLEAETRKLLGLGELDPPPWLDQMREIGYPPGYLEDDEADLSGLAIFGEEEIKDEVEKKDGEIQDMEMSPPPELPTLPKKMSVDFPGINAPIPANADERLWAPPSSNTDSFPYRSSRRFDSLLDSTTRDQSHGSILSRDSRDDGPPGVDTSVYSYSARHASYNPTDSFQSPRRESHLSRYEKDSRSKRHDENAQDNVSYRSHNHASRSSHSGSDDRRKYEDGRDRYTENSSRHNHREGRDSRYKRS